MNNISSCWENRKATSCTYTLIIVLYYFPATKQGAKASPGVFIPGFNRLKHRRNTPSLRIFWILSMAGGARPGNYRADTAWCEAFFRFARWQAERNRWTTALVQRMPSLNFVFGKAGAGRAPTGVCTTGGRPSWYSSMQRIKFRFEKRASGVYQPVYGLPSSGRWGTV
jgi:hypothetical protein